MLCFFWPIYKPINQRPKFGNVIVLTQHTRAQKACGFFSPCSSFNLVIDICNLCCNGWLETHFLLHDWQTEQVMWKSHQNYNHNIPSPIPTSRSPTIHPSRLSACKNMNFSIAPGWERREANSCQLALSDDRFARSALTHNVVQCSMSDVRPSYISTALTWLVPALMPAVRSRA